MLSVYRINFYILYLLLYLYIITTTSSGKDGRVMKYDTGGINIVRLGKISELSDLSLQPYTLESQGECSCSGGMCVCVEVTITILI